MPSGFRLETMDIGSYLSNNAAPDLGADNDRIIKKHSVSLIHVICFIGMRKFVLAILAVAMIVGGGWLLFEQFTVSTIIYGKVVFFCGMLVGIGILLLWEDFISPVVRGSQNDT